MSQKPQNPTLAEVARIAGVSQMTASRALNNRDGVSADKREEILRIAEDLGYVANRVAQRLSGGRTQIIGVVAQLHSAYTADLVLGIGSASRAADYEMLVYSLSDAERQPSNTIVDLLQQIVDGVIVILPFESDYLARLEGARIPIVTVDQGAASSFPSVSTDNYQGARLAVQHLADLGHRRVGFITGNERLASARDRHRAFEDARRVLGLSLDPELVAVGDFMQKGGYEAATRLLALAEPPSAIFAANDISAAGAMAAARAMGLDLPGDLSVIGFDDIPLASHLHPALTTVRQPLPQMARAAVNTLLAMIAGLDAPSPHIAFPAELVERQSTAACLLETENRGLEAAIEV